MKIAFVGTFLAECGVATYSEELCHGLAALGHQPVVLAERTSETSNARWEIPYERCWDRENLAHSMAQVLYSLQNVEPDIIHVQHEFGIFPDDFVTLSFIKKASEIAPVAITLHTVFLKDWPHRPFINGLFALAASRPVQVIIHTLSARMRLGAVWLFRTERLN